MTQAEQYVAMCIKRFTSWGDALRSGKCGNAPWKRWAEWCLWHRMELTSAFNGRNCFWYKENKYIEETRERIILVNGKRTKIKERRLVRV
jgi:hypothetical protein